MVERRKAIHEVGCVLKRRACNPNNGDGGVGYEGVRMRVWREWVTEIRDPVTEASIWLGSFATAEMAARDYDDAGVCLKGEMNVVVTPSVVPVLPKEIQALALAAVTASVPAAAPLALDVAECEEKHENEAPWRRLTSIAARAMWKSGSMKNSASWIMRLWMPKCQISTRNICSKLWLTRKWQIL